MNGSAAPVREHPPVGAMDFAPVGAVDFAPGGAGQFPPVGAAELLRLWERAIGLDPLRRAQVLADDSRSAELSDEPLGRQQARLLNRRIALFGARLEATSSCPECGEVVEFGLDVGELANAGTPTPVRPLECEGYWVEWRSPSPADLAAAGAASAHGADPEGALLERCVQSISGPGMVSGRPDELPPAVRAELARAMSAADPLAEVLIDLDCPECRTRFQTELDVAAFVWTEVDARARRVLLDVDGLARAYGWTEPDILALSEARRGAYLRLITEGSP